MHGIGSEHSYERQHKAAGSGDSKTVIEIRSSAKRQHNIRRVNARLFSRTQQDSYRKDLHDAITNSSDLPSRERFRAAIKTAQGVHSKHFETIVDAAATEKPTGSPTSQRRQRPLKSLI